MPALTLLLANYTQPVLALTGPEIYSKLVDSVVSVVVMERGNRASRQGSAVFLGKSRYVTNCHVTADAGSIYLEAKSRKIPARLVYQDTHRDLCILLADGIKSTPVILSTMKSVVIGQKVYAFGNPEGLTLSLSDGIVSSLRNFDGSALLQTTAPISPGSSGGGLFNENGELIGITTFKAAGGENLNFALPVDWVREIEPRAQTSLQGRAAKQTEKTDLEWDSEASEAFKQSGIKGQAKVCDAWVAASPKNPQAWYCKASAIPMLSEDYYTIRPDALRKAIKLGLNDPNVEIQLALELLATDKADNYAEAEQIALLAANSNSYGIEFDRAEAWIYAGVAAQQLNRIQDAISYYRKATTVRPSSSRAWGHLASDLLFTGALEEAKTACNKALSLDPTSAGMWMILAQINAAAKDDLSLEGALRQAVSLGTPEFLAKNPVEANNVQDAYKQLTILYLRKSRNVEAEALAEQGRVKFNGYIKQFFEVVLGRQQEMKNNWEKARGLYKSAADGCTKSHLFKFSGSESSDDDSVCEGAWYGFGRTSSKLSSKPDVLEAYSRLSILNPTAAASYREEFLANGQ